MIKIQYSHSIGSFAVFVHKLWCWVVSTTPWAAEGRCVQLCWSRPGAEFERKRGHRHGRMEVEARATRRMLRLRPGSWVASSPLRAQRAMRRHNSNSAICDVQLELQASWRVVELTVWIFLVFLVFAIFLNKSLRIFLPTSAWVIKNICDY